MNPLERALQAEGVTGTLADLARSIYQQESSSGRNAKTSNRGAVGGMQVIPATFQRVADPGWNIADPVQNARAGVRYLRMLHEQAGGDPKLTAAGYYGGEGAIPKARAGVAVRDPVNPNAPNTIQYGEQVAARLPMKIDPNTIKWDAPKIDPAQVKWDEPAPEPMKVTINGTAADERSPVQQIIDNPWTALEAPGAGLLKGMLSLPQSVGYLLPKALEFSTSLGGLADNPVSRFFGTSADTMSGANKSVNDAFRAAHGDSALATAGEIGGNIVGASALPFVRGAEGASALWQAGGWANRLKSLLAATGVGAGQGVVLGTQTNADSPVKNALVGGAGGAAGQLVAGAGAGIVNKVREMRAGAPFRAGERITRAAVDPAAVEQRLGSAQTLVPGSQPMAHQVAEDPGVARLAKTVRNYSAQIPAREVQQDAARRAAVESVAPVTGTPIEAATAAGDTITREATAVRAALKDAIRGAYNVPELQGMYLTPPRDEVRQVLRQFYPGKIPSGTPNEAAVKSLVQNLSEGIPIGFPELQKFRKLASDQAWGLANTDPTAAAAYGAIRDILDGLPDRAISAGNLMPKSAKAFETAKGLRRELGTRFETGPAAGMWKRGADKLPQRQGAEVYRGFFNSGPTQGTDIAGLHAMLPDNQNAIDMVRRAAVTDLDNFATKGSSGEYSASKFNNWLTGRGEALPGVFTPDQLGTLGNVGADLSRAERAIALAAAKGGSDTEMNRILSNTAIDSPVLTGAIENIVRRIPVVGNIAATAARGVQGGMSEALRRRAAEELAAVIMDPAAAANAMRTYAQITGSRAAAPAAGPLLLSPALSAVLAQ